MERFGIDTTHALGVSMPAIRGLGKKIKKDHALAQALWDTGIHKARILSSLVDDPAQVTAGQINAWVKDLNSWDLCDQVCGNLFDRTSFAVAKAREFSSRKQEFVKRAGFVLMAEYAVHDKEAVNWALRQIGKRNPRLRAEAIRTAERILKQDSKAARWVAQNALQELRMRK